MYICNELLIDNKMQTTILKEEYVTVEAVINAGIYIWENEAIYAYKYIKGERVIALYGFYKGINKSDGLVDCGNGVYCLRKEDAFLENLTHCE